MLDLLIANGSVVDGAGRPARRADVGLAGDRIVAVGALAGAEARRVVDAAGCLVCPGFIDVHSHSDAYLLIEPSAPSKVFQGVTTEVVGNCGASAAPRLGRGEMPADWQSQSYPRIWRSVAEYRGLLEEVRPAVNVVLLIGHNTLRKGVMGFENRPATPDELARMERTLEKALAEGGRGFSTGLIYAPGRFAPREEILALARTAVRAGGLYASHIRSEGRNLLEALQEAVDIARAAGIPTQVSHLKTAGRGNWSLLDAALEIIRNARAAGLQVAADRYPYTASCTDLDVVLPGWATEGGRDAVLARLRNESIRERILEELVASRPEREWMEITIGSTPHPDHRLFQGRPLSEVARDMGCAHPADAVLRLLDADELKTSAFFHGMSESNMWRILAEPWVMIGSDASLRAPWGPLAEDYPHPRAYGTFPRFLRAALDGRTVSMEEAIRKMTSLPAEQFGLTGRGVLKEGAYADVVVLDPAAVKDRATYARPHQFADGVKAVVVNGVLTLEGGQRSGPRAGRVL